MYEKLRILIVEDLPSDAELVERELRRGGLEFERRRVETREDYLAELAAFAPDLVLSDYRLPSFDGLTAVRLAREFSPGTPVVIVTGSINEETAVECMKGGAADYVLKDRLGRLAPAVRATLEHARSLRDKRQAEVALRSSEARERQRAAELEAVLTAVPIPVWITRDAEARQMWGNPAAERLLRIPPGANSSRTAPPGEWRSGFSIERNGRPIPPQQLPMQRAARGERVESEEVEIAFPDAERRFVLINAAPLLDESGAPTGAVAAGLDLTDRHRAEARLRQLFQAVEQSPAVVVVTDTTGAIEYVNPRFTETTGYSAEEALGRNPRILKSGEMPPEAYRALWQTITGGGTWRGEFHNRSKSGAHYWERASISPIRDAAGRITHFVAVKEDITRARESERALQEMQRQLAQSQKMEAVGRLAGGVAHDFNNLLGVIVGNAELLQSSLPPEHRGRKRVDQILGVANRAAGLTRQLLTFSRKQTLRVQVLDVGEVVRESEKLLRRVIGEDVEMRVIIPPGLGLVMADRGQVEQVLLNLAVNARDAMPDGGHLEMELGQLELDSGLGAEGVPPGRYVVLGVTDSGVGMDAETLARAFEPFFTTKEVGKGTGLGLATVYAIVSRCGGHIRVTSAPGEGASFRIYLPIVDAPASPGAPVGERPRGRGETVLLVEDDAGLREMTTEILSELGYAVLSAKHADEALARAGEHPGLIHLLLTDVVMPGLNGRELASRLTATRPETRVVYMSGYTAEVLGPRGVLEAGVRLLHKPFSAPDIAAMVRAALDE